MNKICFDKSTFLIGIIRDITDRKKVEDANWQIKEKLTDKWFKDKMVYFKNKILILIHWCT